MYSSYTSCSKCNRLIGGGSPYANAYGCMEQAVTIDGRLVCWQCSKEVIESKGLVPFRRHKGQLADTENGQ